MTAADVGRLPVPPGWTIRHVAETGSTNDDLLAEIDRGAADRTVLVTDHQTAGRGRLDRRWDAPPGANLLVSVLFRDVPDDPGVVVRRMALAAREALREWGLDVALKWPNDLLVDDRKLAGILAQRHASGAVVCGMGLNVGWAPQGAACVVDELGPRGAEPPSVAEVLGRLVHHLDGLGRLDADELHERYRAALSTLGRRVRVERTSGDVVGRALDVEADGRLRVLDECGVTHRFAVGDVVHVRREPGS